VDRAAQATYEEFGNVHVVCNNAGVAASGGIDAISLENWRWVLDVNLMGVLHGIRTFLPHIRGHGEGGHIVNTASMAGFNSGLGLSPYVASKFAVVGISEGLSMQLKPHGIAVTVLCPGFVRTRIGDSGRNRQPRYGETPVVDPSGREAALSADIAQRIEAGLTRLKSPQKCSLLSGRMNSTYSHIPKCDGRLRSGSPRSCARWTNSLVCNLYSITPNQAAIIVLFRVANRYVGNLPPMPGVFPDYPAPIIRNTDTGTEMVTMRWGNPARRLSTPH
jgi:NAD(P)-dependent dehydrogenase (short-subunit alcohol dehydrogenase family)